MLITKPPNIETKKGVNGQPIDLLTNYFRLARKPNWTIYRYRVDFKPDVELKRLRQFLVRSQAELLGGFLYDGGSQVFAIRSLGQEITEKTVTSRDGTVYQVILKDTGTVAMTESTSLQILNLILRTAMSGLKLQLVGRNFFDPDAKVKSKRPTSILLFKKMSNFKSNSYFFMYTESNSRT